MITTPPFSLITFDGPGEPIPYFDANDIAFQVVGNEPVAAVRMVAANGTVVETVSGMIPQTGGVYYIRPMFTLSADCFKIQLMDGENILAESNTFVRVSDDRYTSNLIYRCNEDDFGFAYCPGYIVNAIRLPFHIRDPKFPQTQEVYKTLSGRRRVMSASIDKEYVLETDYMSEDMHQKIIVALSHDEVVIDGQLLTKTGDYSIDWENTMDDNNVKTAKATCTVSGNISIRNSNCGSRCVAFYFDVQPRTLYVEAV
jgi:hypothetical protein